MDQVPLPFVVDQASTYDTIGTKQVWISQPSLGLDKRQATLQLCIRAEGDQNVKPALVFRGKGNVTLLEKQSYDERMDVYFQQNAWMDTELNMQWCNTTLFPGVGKNDQENVIFADNVGFQQTREFHEACRNEINATVYLLPDFWEKFTTWWYHKTKQFISLTERVVLYGWHNNVENKRHLMSLYLSQNIISSQQVNF